MALLRWSIRVCEAGIARMHENSLPGRTEQEIWAELHFENARSGGEWIETRLLASGGAVGAALPVAARDRCWRHKTAQPRGSSASIRARTHRLIFPTPRARARSRARKNSFAFSSSAGENKGPRHPLCNSLERKFSQP